MDKAGEATFHLAFPYKTDIDPARTSQFGLAAKEVEKVGHLSGSGRQGMKGVHRALRRSERNVA
jgi:hypothetical protein